MLPNVDGLLLVLGLICAVVGWCVIETILWLFSFIEIGLV